MTNETKIKVHMLIFIPNNLITENKTNQFVQCTQCFQFFFHAIYLARFIISMSNNIIFKIKHIEMRLERMIEFIAAAQLIFKWLFTLKWKKQNFHIELYAKPVRSQLMEQ